MDLEHRARYALRLVDRFALTRDVRRIRKAVASLAIAFFVSGCAQDAEERAFFNTGWVSPEAGAEQRLATEPHKPQ